MGIAQRHSSDFNPIECGFSCPSCWLQTETSICDKCSVEIDHYWQAIGWKVVSDVMRLTTKDYKVWYLGVLTIPQSPWNKELTANVEILSITWLSWNFQELEIWLWSSCIKVDTNGQIIKNYRKKSKTKNGRWKWFKWESGKPADIIMRFLEEKLWAKFA